MEEENERNNNLSENEEFFDKNENHIPRLD